LAPTPALLSELLLRPVETRQGQAAARHQPLDEVWTRRRVRGPVRRLPIA